MGEIYSPGSVTLGTITPLASRIFISESMTSLSYPGSRGFKINLWLKAAIDSSSRANQFKLGSDPDSVS